MLMLNKTTFILASASPRRKEILENAGYSFKVCTSDREEIDIIGKEYTEELVNSCAKCKAYNVYNDIKDKNIMIVSCDTVVVYDNIIIGKPKDVNDAKRVLKLLSGKKHFVASSVFVLDKGEEKCGHEITYVTFRDLSDDDIDKYIIKSNPLDKAGSYGIQDEGFDFAIKVEGNMDNVIGFPLSTFKKIVE